MSAQPLTPQARTERSAMRKWTLFIIAFLLLQVVFGGVSVALALRGRGVVVEDDYYNKALHWDDHEALLQASVRLGWNVNLRVGATATTQGQRALIIVLTDKAGLPVEQATVDVTFFPHARPKELVSAQLKSTTPGTYAGSVPLDRPGLWEFRLTIHRPATDANGSSTTAPDDTFIATLQRDLLE